MHLGEELSPTMPLESTEADAYYLTLVVLSGEPTGDGGEMELSDLIGPKVVTAKEGLQAMDAGLVADAGRARTLHGRALAKMGYLPALDVWVHDHPELLSSYSTLGLGEVQDPRGQARPGETPPTRVPSQSLAARVNHVVSVEREELVVSSRSKMIDAQTVHAVKEGEEVSRLEPSFANQYLALDYDRAKIVHYFSDPERGPMVQMKRQLRPPLALAEGLSVYRRDVEDVRRPRSTKTSPKEARELGKPCSASAGQSDLYYQFWAKQVPASEDDFVTLAEALRLCRKGHGDSQTEALLLRLAQDLQWLPHLGLSLGEARERLR